MPDFGLSRRARSDLVDIGVFGAERWGDERSERYVAELYAVFQQLADGRAILALRPHPPWPLAY